MLAPSDKRPGWSRLTWLWWLVTFTLIGLSLAAPWFGWAEHSDVHTTRDLGLLAEVYCSDFARAAIKCRPDWLWSDDTVWLLLPVFCVLRVVAIAIHLGALGTLVYAALRRDARARSALLAASLVFLVGVAAVFAAVPGDQQYEPYGVAWGGFVALAAVLCFVVGPLGARVRERIHLQWLVAAVCILVASLWAPWVYVAPPAHEAAPVPGVGSEMAKAFGTLGSIRYWKPAGRADWTRVSRVHYVGDRLKGRDLGHLDRAAPYLLGAATAAIGLVLALRLLRLIQARSLGAEAGALTPRTRRTRLLAIAYALAGAVLVVVFCVAHDFQFGAGSTRPEVGLALAAVGAILALVTRPG